MRITVFISQTSLFSSDIPIVVHIAQQCDIAYNILAFKHMVRKKDDGRYEMISGHKVIQNVLGHVDISTTMNIYIDVTNDLKKEEMLTYAKFVGNSKGKIETAV